MLIRARVIFIQDVFLPFWQKPWQLLNNSLHSQSFYGFQYFGRLFFNFAWGICANDKPACAAGKKIGAGENEKSRPQRFSSEKRCLHTGIHHHSEEAEFSATQSGQGSINERDGSDDVYTRRGTQSPGALDRSRSGRPSQGPARCSLPHRKGCLGHGGRAKSQTGTFQVRGQKAQVDRSRFDRQAREVYGPRLTICPRMYAKTSHDIAPHGGPGPPL